MASPKTLLVDGTDLRTLDGVTITDRNLVSLYAPATRRGQHDVIPGKRGQLGAELAVDAYTFTVPVAVTGTDEADLEQNLSVLASTVAGGSTGGLVSLARRLAKVGGGYNTHTASGAFAGFANFNVPGPLDIEVDLQFINLDGAWFNGTYWQTP